MLRGFDAAGPFRRDAQALNRVAVGRAPGGRWPLLQNSGFSPFLRHAEGPFSFLLPCVLQEKSSKQVQHPSFACCLRIAERLVQRGQTSHDFKLPSWNCGTSTSRRSFHPPTDWKPIQGARTKSRASEERLRRWGSSAPVRLNDGAVSGGFWGIFGRSDRET